MFSPEFHELEQGSEEYILLSEYWDDDEEDYVTLTVELSDSQAEWIEWIWFDDLYNELIVKPTLDTPMGTFRIKVILDDSKE